MEYKRLTKRICGAVTIKGEYGDTISFFDRESNRVIDRLAELEDKIEQGTLIELPCKVGVIIYYVGSYQIGTWKKKIRYDIFEFPFTLEMLDSYGNNWFLTREEAEKRLKELQNG